MLGRKERGVDSNIWSSSNKMEGRRAAVWRGPQGRPWWQWGRGKREKNIDGREKRVSPDKLGKKSASR